MTFYNGMNIPDEIYNWLVTFLNGRSHVTRYAGRKHPVSPILMPAWFRALSLAPLPMTLASDLHPLSLQNIILKYADDTYLLVPSSNRHTVPSELPTSSLHELPPSSLHELPPSSLHELPPSSLHEVTRSTVLARLLYAAPAWRGFAPAQA